jgi:hypothetical protein
MSIFISRVRGILNHAEEMQPMSLLLPGDGSLFRCIDKHITDLHIHIDEYIYLQQ